MEITGSGKRASISTSACRNLPGRSASSWSWASWWRYELVLAGMEKIFLIAARGVLQFGSVTVLITHQCPAAAEEGLHSSFPPLCPHQEQFWGQNTAWAAVI